MRWLNRQRNSLPGLTICHAHGGTRITPAIRIKKLNTNICISGEATSQHCMSSSLHVCVFKPMHIFECARGRGHWVYFITLCLISHILARLAAENQVLCCSLLHHTRMCTHTPHHLGHCVWLVWLRDLNSGSLLMTEASLPQYTKGKEEFRCGRWFCSWKESRSVARDMSTLDCERKWIY